LKPIQIVEKPISNIAQPSVVPSTNSTTTELPYLTTTEVREDYLVTTPSIDSHDALADVSEVTSSPSSSSSFVDEMELVGSSSTVLPALLGLRGVVTREPITEEEEYDHTTTLGFSEDSSSEDDRVSTTMPYGMESTVPTTDIHSTILLEATSLDYTAKPTVTYSTTEVPVLTTLKINGSLEDADSMEIDTTEGSTAGGYTDSTKVPIFTTTLELEVTEKTDSLYEGTTETSRKTTVSSERVPSTVGTTDVPNQTTMEIETEETVSSEETTVESRRTTVGNNSYATVKTTEAPIKTTTVKMVTRTSSPYEETTEENIKTTAGNTDSTDEETTAVDFTTTMKIASKKTDSPNEDATEDTKTTAGYSTTPSTDYVTDVSVLTTNVETGTETTTLYERSVDVNQQRSVSNTGLIPLFKNFKKGIVRREDALAKQREEQRTSSGSDLNMVSSEEETGRGHNSPKAETGFEKLVLRRLINMIVRELRQNSVSKEEKARLKEAFGDMWYSIVNEAFNYVPVQLPDKDVPQIASRVLEYLLKGTALARRLKTQSVKGRNLRSRRDARRPRLEPWQEMLLRAVMARPLTASDEQRNQAILNAIKDQLRAPEEDLEYDDEETDDDVGR